MKIKRGDGKTEYGPGISIDLTGSEVAQAIDAWLLTNGVNVHGARTVTINGKLCESGNVYVDPSAAVSITGRATNVEFG